MDTTDPALIRTNSKNPVVTIEGQVETKNRVEYSCTRPDGDGVPRNRSMELMTPAAFARCGGVPFRPAARGIF